MLHKECHWLMFDETLSDKNLLIIVLFKYLNIDVNSLELYSRMEELYF